MYDDRRQTEFSVRHSKKKKMQTAQVYAEITLNIWTGTDLEFCGETGVFFSLLPGITFYFQNQTWAKPAQHDRVSLSSVQALRDISSSNLEAKDASCVSTFTLIALKSGTPSLRPLVSLQKHHLPITCSSRVFIIFVILFLFLILKGLKYIWVMCS